MDKKAIRFHKTFNKLKKNKFFFKKNNIIKINKKKNNFSYKSIYFLLKLCDINNKYNKLSRIKNICLITGKYKTIFKQINLNRKFLKGFLLNNKVPNIEKIYW